MWAISVLHQSTSTREEDKKPSISITEITDKETPIEQNYTTEQFFAKTEDNKHQTKMKSNVVTKIPGNYVKMRK